MSAHPRNLTSRNEIYNFDLLKPQCYIVKLEFTGVYIIFLISAQKHRLWVLVLLMYTLEWVSSVANFITAYEESQ